MRSIAKIAAVVKWLFDRRPKKRHSQLNKRTRLQTSAQPTGEVRFVTRHGAQYLEVW